MRVRNVAYLWLLIVGSIVLFPLLIPAGIVFNAVDKHRKRKSARSFVCVSCGVVLGPRSIELAEQAAREHESHLRRLHPDEIFRIVETCQAICPACGTRYTFVEKERTFVLESLA